MSCMARRRRIDISAWSRSRELRVDRDKRTNQAIGG